MCICFSRQQERRAAGLTEQRVTVAGHRIVYLTGGKGDTVLLLHGFSADKDNWTRFAKYLTASYRVVAPDLPGFGDSDKHDDALYDVGSQVKPVAALASALDLQSFHLADFARVLGIVFVEQPAIPRPVMRYLAQKSVESRAFNEKIAGQLAANQSPLEPILPKLKRQRSSCGATMIALLMFQQRPCSPTHCRMSN